MLVNGQFWELPGLLAYTEGAVWRPGIGDPTVMGWVTVAAYFAAALLCGWTAARAGGPRASEGRFWGALCLALILLGVNKQLDLQTWFTLAGKRLAIAQGWYESRRLAQAAFIILVAAGGAAGAWWLWKNMRHAPGANWLALAGFAFLAGFILIRAASLHHMDGFLKTELAGVRMNWLFELAGIALLAAAAWHRGRGPAPAAETRLPERSASRA